MRSLSLTALALVIAGLLGGCVSTTDSGAFLSAVRSTPMGPSQFMVTCVDSPMYCANESNKLCPNGFDVKSNVTNPADYGRMTMIIKCN
jgi:hypothetical protein